MFNLNINLSVTKNYHYAPGDRQRDTKKGIGFLEVLKNLCNKVYPYLIILKVLAFIGHIFIH